MRLIKNLFDKSKIKKQTGKIALICLIIKFR